MIHRPGQADVEQVAVADLVRLDRVGELVQRRDDDRRELQPLGRVDRQQPDARPRSELDAAVGSRLIRDPADLARLPQPADRASIRFRSLRG